MTTINRLKEHIRGMLAARRAQDTDAAMIEQIEGLVRNHGYKVLAGGITLPGRNSCVGLVKAPDGVEHGFSIIWNPEGDERDSEGDVVPAVSPSATVKGWPPGRAPQRFNGGNLV